MEEEEPTGEFRGESQPEQRKSGTPRLYIKELVMRNFKSYAGEQRVGPFHKSPRELHHSLLGTLDCNCESFSAVVGPNGSGKSNVIDAMLFVFGKRAKQMRLNKVSELIHNSTNHQNLDSAGVSVQFEEIIDKLFRRSSGEDGSYETVPGSDFMITRGEVEQISLMKPKAQGPHDEGFLEYLEDIIGTNKYVEKIDELNKELETLNEKRSGVVQMVKLAEKERDNLEGVKDEAETYMLKELSYLKWQEKATKMAHEDTLAKITEQKESLQNLENSLKNDREKMDESNKELKELESVHEKHKKTQEGLDNELRECKEKFKEFERQDVKHREDLKHVKQKIKKLEDKLQKDSSKINDLTKECEDSRDLIPKLQENIPKLQEVLVDEEKALEEIKEKAKVETEAYRSELTKIRAELEPWEKDLIVHKGKLDVASSESELLSNKHEAALKAFTDAQKQLTDISGRKEEKSAATTSIKADIEKKKLEAMEARKVEEESQREQETLIPQEQAAREKVAELKSAMNSERSQGDVLKAVLRAKENNQIEGIYGRMGDLGAIDAKYDVAVSTACGGLDYIVVETTSAAQACVELLRKGNLGVATFMILEKQTNHLQRLKERVKTPEDVPRLFDLIRVKDERMKLAFYASLGNTVVAKDLDQATRIAYGGNREFQRVVTLDGALFEKSGTMSGGGGKPRGGRMGTSIRATGVSGEVVANAENELFKIVDMLNHIREKIGNAVRQYRAAENEASRLEMELAKSQREIESLNSEHNYLEKQLASLEAASQPKTDEIDRLKELKKIISKEEKEIEKLEKGSKQLKEKALELQTSIENAGGENLKGQKAKVEKIQTDIDKSNTEINRCNVQIETHQKMIKKLTKGIEDGTREKERLEVLCVVQLIDEHKDVLTEAKSNFEKLKKSVDELKASRVDAEFKVQDMKKKYNELELKEKGYKKKLNDLQIALTKHMEQYKDLVDPDKLQATLMDNNLNEACDLKKALEMAALLEAQLKELNPNLDSIAEYRSKVELYNGRVDELNSVTQERDDIRKQHDELRKRRLDEFMAGFNTISLKLKEMYQMITLGGDAELELVDSLDPFSEGVVFSVRPPKKSWKNIANLSGGEKTLSSLALVFALHHYKPTPLYVMDEIDAALDFKNVSIVGHYVKDRTKDAQFIIISLRNNMFELADRLVGIYKTDNCTKSITINPGSFAVSQKTPA
ncbi:hypothetical protein YC2023_073950 [Brassica napus]